MSPRLFGTDGIRGPAGAGPLAPDALVRLGRAIAGALEVGGPLAPGAAAADRPRRAVLARDTRESGPMIRDALAAGLGAGGVSVVDLGVLPTPGLALLAADRGADVGIVISASHNPAADNGVKLLRPDGRKVDVAAERFIESRLAELGDRDGAVGGVRAEPIEHDPGAAHRYVDRLTEQFLGKLDLSGVTVAYDGANGAGYGVGPAILERLRARVETIGCDGVGGVINQDVGATVPKAVQALAADRGARWGISVDGDADRVILVDEEGTIRDGDDILWILAGSGVGESGCVVSTVMANFGLEQALRERGVELVRTDVGDRNVSEAMDARGALFGAEPSGHVICAEHAPTGDGIHTALRVLTAVQSSGKTMAELCAPFRKSPHVLRNVRVASKPPLAEVASVAEAIANAEEELAERGGGRILVRYSGTEPKARVLAEGPDEEAVRDACDLIVRTIERELGES